MRFRITLFTILCAFAIISCQEQGEKQEIKRSLNNLEVYVDSLEKVHNNRELNYTRAEWQRIDSNYQARKEAILMQTEGSKENDKLNEIDNRYQSFEEAYQQQRQLRRDEATRGVESARETLGITGTSSNTGHITAENYLQVYRNFIDTVDKYKKSFSTEDWDNIDKYRQTLKKRQEAINNKIKTDQRIQIAEMDTKYGAMKMHKIGARIEEETQNNN